MSNGFFVVEFIVAVFSSHICIVVFFQIFWTGHRTNWRRQKRNDYEMKNKSHTHKKWPNFN